MSIIDTRLADIQNLQKRHLELKDVYPAEAIKIERQMGALQKGLARDMAPLKALMASSSILS